MRPEKLRQLQKKALKTTESRMKSTAPIQKFVPVIAMTTAKRRGVPPGGVRIGVVKNDTTAFPNFSAPALASVFEYGTPERFRRLKTLGIVTGRASTGRFTAKPWLRKAMDDTYPIYHKEFLASVDKEVDG